MPCMTSAPRATPKSNEHRAPHEFLASGREKTMAADDAQVTGYSSCFGA
jgi:hypothetical protein